MVVMVILVVVVIITTNGRGDRKSTYLGQQMSIARIYIVLP